MKAKLIFNLPMERNEFMLAIKGEETSLILYDFMEYLLRRESDVDQSDEVLNMLEEIRSEFLRLCAERGLDPYGA